MFQDESAERSMDHFGSLVDKRIIDVPTHILLSVSLHFSAAFAPISQKSSAQTSLAAWKDETVVGITAPTGFFDPLGLSKGKSDEIMEFYREAELKNGRVAMAACLGWYLNAGGVHPAFNSELSNNPLEAAQAASSCRMASILPWMWCH